METALIYAVARAAGVRKLVFLGSVHYPKGQIVFRQAFVTNRRRLLHPWCKVEFGYATSLGRDGVYHGGTRSNRCNTPKDL